jgi:hypothetical protein
LRDISKVLFIGCPSLRAISMVLLKVVIFVEADCFTPVF